MTHNGMPAGGDRPGDHREDGWQQRKKSKTQPLFAQSRTSAPPRSELAFLGDLEQMVKGQPR